MKHLRAILAGVIGAAIAAGLLLALRPLLRKSPAEPTPDAPGQTTPGQTFVVGGQADPNGELASATDPVQEVVTDARAEADAMRLEQQRQRRLTSYAAKVRRRREAEERRLATEAQRAEEQAKARARQAAAILRARRGTKATSAPATTSAPASQPATVAELLAAGDQALADGKNREAEALFRQALVEQPKNVDALGALAMALLAKRDFEASIPVYQEMIGLLADARHERSNLALAYARCGMYRQAEAVYRDLLRDYPDLLEARVNYAIMLYQDQGKLADALTQWIQVAKQDPTLYDAHQALGEIYVDLNQPKKALLAFCEAANLRPRLPGAWLNVATTSEAAGEGGFAALAYEKALKYAPYDADLLRRKGDLHLHLFKESEAKARKTDPTGKGDVSLLRTAVNSWRESLKMDGEQPDLREVLKFYEPLAGSPVVDAPAP